MFDYATMKLMHPHGEELFPVEEVSRHDAADHDLERTLRPGARIFRCTDCAEEIVVMAPGADEPASGTT